MHPNWFENLFLKNARKFYLVALGITGQRELAEDAVHDAMVCRLALESDARIVPTTGPPTPPVTV
jgi:DNA-directed RNA polymerase specialized sigma24 family protein